MEKKLNSVLPICYFGLAFILVAGVVALVVFTTPVKADSSCEVPFSIGDSAWAACRLNGGSCTECYTQCNNICQTIKSRQLI
mgnify:FL=1